MHLKDERVVDAKWGRKQHLGDHLGGQTKVDCHGFHRDGKEDLWCIGTQYLERVKQSDARSIGVTLKTTEDGEGERVGVGQLAEPLSPVGEADIGIVQQSRYCDDRDQAVRERVATNILNRDKKRRQRRSERYRWRRLVLISRLDLKDLRFHHNIVSVRQMRLGHSRPFGRYRR